MDGPSRFLEVFQDEELTEHGPQDSKMDRRLSSGPVMMSQPLKTLSSEHRYPRK